MDGQPPIGNRLEADGDLSGDVLGAVAERYDRLNDVFDGFDGVWTQQVAEEIGETFAHHGHPRTDGVDAYAGPVKVAREASRWSPTAWDSLKARLGCPMGGWR